MRSEGSAHHLVWLGKHLDVSKRFSSKSWTNVVRNSNTAFHTEEVKTSLNVHRTDIYVRFLIFFRGYVCTEQACSRGHLRTRMRVTSTPTTLRLSHEKVCEKCAN
jgi:hypothetical protein